MLTLDISSTLARAITPSLGIPDQELSGLRSSMRRYIDDWLKERRQGKHAWSMVPYDKQAIALVKEVAERVKTEHIRTVVWVGIGGSALGPQVIQEAFENPDTVEFVLLDSIDPAYLEMMLKFVDWKSTLLVIASKSGSTLEPMSIFFLCFERLRATMKDRGAAERTIAVTDVDAGPLRTFCAERGIAMLPIPADVGGRYSVFTPVGLLAMALLSQDVNQFVRGAKEMDTACQSASIDDNPAALLASVQFLLDTKRGYCLRTIMPYSQRLAPIARWDQQLIAESLGKVETANPIPMAAIGTQDQHSLLQQWMAGPRKSWHLFIRETERPRLSVPDHVPPTFEFMAGKTFGQLLDACYEGTSRALLSAKRPSVTITLPRLDAGNLGQLFYLFMTEAVLLGKLYRIDPYSQPAVEAGKKITKTILSKGRTEE
ncbi:MAG: hypothetical protein PHH13_04865 [Candidatus Peribacteraceae bacterium]|nr:hypothetical protein [Candidatus Peribacteraceae bacterium]